jgi:type VI secretion system protein ImpL
MMRWGLYQAGSISNAARDGYLRELDGLVLPRFAARIRQRVVGYASDPDQLYDYLKAYLMLGEPEHVDEKHLQDLADVEWTAAAGTAALSQHFHSLLELSDALRPTGLDQPLVAQARSSVRQVSVARIMYARIKRSYAADPRVVQLSIAGMGIEDVLRRKSGVSLAQPVPAFYGRPVFKEVADQVLAELARRLAEDSWVWGGAGPTVANPLRLGLDVLDLYERDYIVAWDDILDDVEIKPSATVGQTANALGILAGPTSPLRGLLAVVVDNTSLVQAPNTGETPGALASAAGAVTDRLGKILKSAKDVTGLSTRQPGSLVAAHFVPIHQLMAGAAGQAPIDTVLGQLAQIQQQLKAMGPEVGGTNPMQALGSPALRDLLQSLKDSSSTLAPAIGALVSQIGHRAEASVLSGANADIERLYRQRVVEPCSKAIAGRYPFDPGSQDDVLLVDFARVFGPGGLFDTFFAENQLEQYVDKRGSSWTWRRGGEILSSEILSRFEAAQHLRTMFFRAGSGLPQLDFSVTLTDADAATTRFVLEIDGQVADDRNGALRKWPRHWPASDPGMAAATFIDIAGPWAPLRREGPWAWFRLFDEGRPQRESDQRVSLAFQNVNHRARVIVDADSIRNPFTNREWRRFSCGS